MKRFRWVMLLGLIIVIASAITAVIVAPPVSSVVQTPCLKSGENCLQFPTVTGANLPGDVFTLPQDFAGDYTFIIIPFDEEQQMNADTWLPFTRQLEAEHPDLTYYNVPIFPDIPAPIRTLIRSGMSLAIRDESLHTLTITVFLENRDTFLSALDIPDTAQIQVFLLNTTGEVLWRGEGVFTPEQGNSLAEILK